MHQYEVMFAGFGGQGIMTAGQLLAYAGIKEGKHVAWIPSYGPEMRGGTAYCTVVVSDLRIGSPIVTNPRCVCAFNRPSFDKFEPKVKAGGLLLVNSSLIDIASTRSDISQLYVPANEMAIMAGSPKSTNIIVLGAFVGASGVVSIETLRKVVKEKLASKASLLETNLRLLDDGYELGHGKIRQKDTV